jgi:dTDP-4-amino-4,6-dideoxygalactose transaminase
MAFIPYSRQDIDEEDIAAVNAVLRSEFLTQGPAVADFEAAFATRHRAAHAVSVANATAGLHIACLALGVAPGSRVWTSPNSFLASANCALYCGANVDFVDIDPRTRNMSLEALVQKLKSASRQGALPHVLIPVDFSGLPCDLRELWISHHRRCISRHRCQLPGPTSRQHLGGRDCVQFPCGEGRHHGRRRDRHHT